MKHIPLIAALVALALMTVASAHPMADAPQPEAGAASAGEVTVPTASA
jgi:hypothetical protein